ncbi:MAG: glycosyltransferase family 2 protein [Lentisphaeria bacterium]|nr:glycosyltransferase family 2 protein [Lentisphaeria bacterium]
MSADFAIVLINWNGLEDTRTCLRSLARASLPETTRVVVVDNGSTDGSVAAIRGEFSWGTVLELGRNAGFAGGNNAGIRYALERGAELILLLNSDTTVARDTITELLEAADRHPDVAGFGGKIYCMDDPNVLWFAGGELPGRTLGAVHYGDGERDSGRHDTPRLCNFLTGCMLMARASAWRTVGLLDEGMFFLWEDTDWCARCAAQGLRLLYVPSARIWHRGSASTGGSASPLAQYYYERNHLRYMRRFAPARLPVRVIGRLLRLVRNILGTAWRRILGRPAVPPLPWRMLWRFWVAWFLGIADFLRGRSGAVPGRYLALFRGKRVP